MSFRWQQWARLALALAGLGCAAAIYVTFGHRPAGKIPPVVPPADPTTTSEMGPGYIDRQKDGEISLHVEFRGRTTYSDDRVSFNEAHIVSFDDRGLEMWGDAVDTSGKALQSDNPAQFTLTGHVRFRTKDGLDAHMDTATYNDLTGVLIAPGLVTFTKGRMSGQGDGANYNKRDDVLVLLDRSHVIMGPDAEGKGAFDATTHQLTLDRPHDVARLERDARIVRDGDTLTGDNAVVHSTEDQNHVTRIELAGRARVVPAPAATPGSGPPDMQADDIDLGLREDGQTIQHALLVSRTSVAVVDMVDADNSHRVVTGSRVNFDLAPDGKTLTSLDAAKPVTVVLPPTRDAGAREITADALTAVGAAPAGLKNADFTGTALVPVKFVEHVVPAAGSAKTAESVRTVRSEHLTTELNGQLDAISLAKFRVNVTLEDNDGRAGADIADYDSDRKIMFLSQAPGSRAVPWAFKTDTDSERHVEARTINLFLDNSNNLNAAGAVKTKSLQLSKEAGHAASPIFAGDSPIFGSADTLSFVGTQATYTSTASRRAELHQDNSRVTGQTIVFDSTTNDLKADGRVESRIISDDSSSGSGKSSVTTYDVTDADALVYVDAERIAHFRGKAVKLTSTDGTTTAQTADLHFAQDSRQIEHMTFEGDVRADLSGRRRGVGERLTYDAMTETYVITGKAEALAPATSAPDSKCTLTQGNRLTFERNGNTADGALNTINDAPCDAPLPYKPKATGRGGVAPSRTERGHGVPARERAREFEGRCPSSE